MSASLDFRGKAVLVTGGTRGIGLATGLAFGRRGAACVLTHKWSSADETAIADAFASVGAPPPIIVQADASRDEDARRVVEITARCGGRIEALVSNVAFGPAAATPADYTKRGLTLGIEYSAWPLASHFRAICDVTGAPPRYAVGVSACGPDRFIPNYDMMAAAKSVLETLARYLAHHYRGRDSRINVVRAGLVETESLEAILGAGHLAALKARNPDAFMAPREVADVILALCSGLMDSVTGQTIDADHGNIFSAGAFVPSGELP